jgi:starvation-inducible DNA-binding protein
MWVQKNDSPQVTAQRAQVLKAEMPMPEGTPIADLVAALRRTLADAVTFYLRAHGYHWNVVGSDFAEYHALFEAIYVDTLESIDPLGEIIRKLDGIAPFRLPELMALRSIGDDSLVAPLPAAMSADLLAANEMMLDTLRNAFAIATGTADEQGVANFLAERIDQHQKWSWQLRSSLA